MIETRWWVLGTAIGLLNVLSFANPFFHKPFGISTGITHITGLLISLVSPVYVKNNVYYSSIVNIKLGWAFVFVAGIIAGAFVSSLRAKEFKFRFPAKRLPQAFMGGTLMGFGARFAGGCNVGLILTGIPKLSIGALIGGVFILVGCATAAKLLFR